MSVRDAAGAQNEGSDMDDAVYVVDGFFSDRIDCAKLR